jgi:LysM repeat protein
MRRLIFLFPMALSLLACNLTERVLVPQQLPTLASTPGADFIAPTAVPTVPASPTAEPGANAGESGQPGVPTLESVTGSMTGGQESMVAAAPTTRAENNSQRATATLSPDCQPIEEWSARYTIVSGDRLSIIADRYGLTVQELAQANCIPNPDRISVGQVLRVPEGMVTVAPPSPIPLTTPDADGFTTYTNRELGISLRYPPGWNRVEPGAYINLVSPDGSSVFEILVEEGGTTPQAQADACRAGQGCPRGGAMEGQVIEVDGLPAYRLDLSEAGSLRVIVFFTLNGRNLAIRGFGDVSAFEQILATLRIGY